MVTKFVPAFLHHNCPVDKIDVRLASPEAGYSKDISIQIDDVMDYVINQFFFDDIVAMAVDNKTVMSIKGHRGVFGGKE